MLRSMGIGAYHVGVEARTSSLPIGSKVVPFWEYLIGSPKNTTKWDYFGAYG